MVQIHFELGRVRGDGHVCKMELEMSFDRYEDGQGSGTKSRCVFAENPLTTGARMRGLTEPGWRSFERKKSSALRKKIKLYLGGGSGGSAAAVAEGGRRGRCDLPPYQIRIKSLANDTELPKLEVNLQGARREISFEWQGMFDAFYSEAAMRLEKERGDMAPLVIALEAEGGDGSSLVSIVRLVGRSRKAYRASVKRIRRDRIRNHYLREANLNLSFNDKQHFSRAAERTALSGIASFERWYKSARYAEDAEAKRMAELYGRFGFRGRFDIGHEVTALIRESQGVGEDDKGGLLALYKEMVQADVEVSENEKDDDDDDSDEDKNWRTRPTGIIPRSMYRESTDDDEN